MGAVPPPGLLLWKSSKWNKPVPNPVFEPIPEGAKPIKKIYINNGKLEVVYDDLQEGEEQGE